MSRNSLVKTDMLQPHNVEAEEALLGSLVMDNGYIKEMKETVQLKGRDFFVERNGWIYDCMVKIHDRSMATDIVTLNDELAKEGILIEIGGPAYITSLINCTPTSINAPYYAQIVKMASIRRKLIELSQKEVTLSWGENNNPKELTDRLNEIQSYKLKLISQFAELQNINLDQSYQIHSFDNIMAADYPEKEWLIKGILPLGELIALVGRPKCGKSFLTLQWHHALGAEHGRVFNEPVQQVPTLYLALEDYAQRIYERASKQGYIAGNMSNIAFAWPDLKNGGLERLEKVIIERGYKLVTLDTFSRSTSIDHMKIEDVTDSLKGLQRIAREQKCTLLIIDHTRKKNGNGHSGIEDILGTTAKSANYDVIIELYRGQGQQVAELSITGRVPDQELSLQFNKDMLMWECLGNHETVGHSKSQAEIIETIEALNNTDEKANLKNISEDLGKDKANVRRAIIQMVKDGILIQNHDKTYDIAQNNEE